MLTSPRVVLKMRFMGTDRVTLKIPRPLYEKLRIVIEGSGFSSVNEFVVYILRDLLSVTGTTKKDLSSEEVDAIRKRLENLGYF
jgi:Arc/MetJ-type ribon-helix-helix transcriptional regulator